MSPGKDLIPRFVRNTLAQVISGNGPYSVGQIIDFFDAHEFTATVAPTDVGRGQRRDTAESCLAGIDWRSPDQAERFLQLLRHVVADLNLQDARERRDALRGAIERADLGELDIDGSGHLQLPYRPVPTIDTSSVPAEADLRLHLERLERADGEPEELIGAAKDLVEATAQHVLLELGQPAGPKDDVRALSKQALRSLALHPESLAPTTRGANAVTSTLQGLGQVAVGIAELRNEHGVGHGKARRYRLYKRHGELARRAALAYAGMLLDTLHDPNAPWRKDETATSARQASDGQR